MVASGLIIYSFNETVQHPRSAAEGGYGILNLGYLGGVYDAGT
jgi:hypothetical protein